MTKKIFILGALSLLPYGYALYLQDLRARTLGFELAFLIAFGLYAWATILALKSKSLSPRETLMTFGLAAIMQALLVFTPPTLSDDMYRYVWDGRVQANGISPYRYPPDSPHLAQLTDQTIWVHINRKPAVTIYPPAAEMAFAVLWRVWPDNVRWFQVATAAGGLLAGGLLVGLLRALQRSTSRVLIYLWSPLLAFETAHAAHVDGLMLPLLVGAWWARVRERDGLTGVLLALATAMKLYPALLFPALWRPNHPRGRWKMPLAFILTLAVCYAPYVAASGTQVLGFLPSYLHEQFNLGPLVSGLITGFKHLGIASFQGILWLTLAGLALAGLWMVFHPAVNGESAVRRCIWLIGSFTLLNQDLFSWYMLWVLPLTAIFLQLEGNPRLKFSGLRLDAWTGWWLFCGLAALSYAFFLKWKPVPAAIWAQFIPLYGLLALDGLRRYRSWRNAAQKLPEKSPLGLH
jgi:alpha-1,6-mannosyltransferase